jgi:hypothetical protein
MRSLTLRSLLMACAWVLLSLGVAHAHGGMAGPDELGPPVGLSVAIGLACYFGITLWPSHRRDLDSRKPAGRPARQNMR